MIKCGDCLELMKELPDGSVDMILADLPYGTTSCAFDIRLPFEPMWEQFKRVTKHNAAIVLFSQMPFGAELIMSNRKMFRYEWIWEKSLGVGFLNAKKMPLRCHENILVFYRKLPTYNPQFTHGKPYRRFNSGKNVTQGNYQNHIDFHTGHDGSKYCPRDTIKFASCHSGNFSPQQKPIPLLEYLIKTYTNEGELVLDATMGSGSTCIAAINTNRRFIGYEMEETFFNIAQKRIERALVERQGLF